MKFASNIVFYIFIIINSLKPKECKSLLKKINGKKAITKNITDLVNSQEGIMGIIDGINKDIIRDTDLESRRLRLKHEGGSAEDSFFGSDKNDTEQYVNNISIYKEKKTDLSNAVETLTNVLESIGDTRDSLRYKVNPAGKMDNIDDESFFYFFPHTLQLREKKSFMDNNNNNNEIKTEVEDHQVEEYLLKCSELEILYLKKHEELIVLIGEISNLIEKIITFLNVLRILISHFNQKNCDKNIKKHKLYTNSVTDNLGDKLKIQEQIRKGLIPVDFYPVPDNLPPQPRLSQASESSLPGFESLPSPSPSSRRSSSSRKPEPKPRPKSSFKPGLKRYKGVRPGRPVPRPPTVSNQQLGLPVLRNSQGVFPTFNRPSSASASQNRPLNTPKPRSTRASILRQQLSKIQKNQTNKNITRRGNKSFGSSSKTLGKGKKSKKVKRTSRKRGSKKKKENKFIE